MDAAPQQAEETHRFPCEQCGADYRFAPAEGALICDHCGHKKDLTESPWGGGALKELDFLKALREQLPAAEMEMTRGSSCPRAA